MRSSPVVSSHKYAMIPHAERRLLLVFAHPDDESVFAAGLACETVSRGGRVALCTATPGDRGKVGDPPICSRERLGAVRQAELMAACAELGIATLRVLGYPDRGLASAPADTIRRQLVELIRAMRPQVAVTFDPNGTEPAPRSRGHQPFHLRRGGGGGGLPAVSRTRRGPRDAPPAVDAAGPPRELLRRTAPALEPGADVALDVSAFVARKEAALKAHQTQHQNLNRIFFSKPDVTRLLGVELFRQAFGPPLASRPIGDVFAGLLPDPD